MKKRYPITGILLALLVGVALLPSHGEIGFGPVSGVENQLDELDEKVDRATGRPACTFSTDAAISPIEIDDIDGDQSKEIVFGSSDGTVYALNNNCFKEWETSLGLPVVTRPAIGNLGSIDPFTPEVFVATGDTVVVLKDDGNKGWTYDLSATACSSPRFARLDAGKTILVGDTGSQVHAINPSGGNRWTFGAGDWVCTTPAVGDIDNDNSREVVAGSRDDTVYAINSDGSPAWSSMTGGNVFSSPAIGDLKPDNNLQVVVGSDDGLIYELAGSDGSEDWSFDAMEAVRNSPALGDLDGDGQLEIAASSYDPATQTGHLYVLERDGALNWSKSINRPSSPAIGEIDGDGELEVVIGTADGLVIVYESNGNKQWDYSTGSSVVSSDTGVIDAPELADVTGDGASEIAVGTKDGTIYVLE